VNPSETGVEAPISTCDIVNFDKGAASVSGDIPTGEKELAGEKCI